MALLRAFSTRRSSRGYERLLEVGVEEEEEVAVASAKLRHFEYEAQLKRARSVPARVFGLSRKFVIAPQLQLPPLHEAKCDQLKKSKSKSTSKTTTTASSKKVTKSHPLFSLFDGRRKKKTTEKPEFSRYIEYLKEGGMWDMNANMPVIYYK